jgi:hypothetical protein
VCSDGKRIRSCAPCWKRHREGLLLRGEEEIVARGRDVSELSKLAAKQCESPRVPFSHQRKLQVPRLRSPGFPVEHGGVGELHAPFFTERRTRGSVQCNVAGNPGRDDKV